MSSKQTHFELNDEGETHNLFEDNDVFPPDYLFGLDDEEWHIPSYSPPSPLYGGWIVKSEDAINGKFREKNMTMKNLMRADEKSLEPEENDWEANETVSESGEKDWDADEKIELFPLPMAPPNEELRGIKHPGSIVGHLVSRLPFQPIYKAIEIVAINPFFEPEKEKKVFPTCWIHMRNPYWIQAVDDGLTGKIGVPYTRLSHIDNISITTTRQKNGDIWAERWGVTVVIFYGNGGTGGFTQPMPLKNHETQWTAKSRQKKNVWKRTVIEHAVGTASISAESPYWARLVSGIAQTEYGKSFRIKSDIDGVECIIGLEDDYSVNVRRLHKTVKLLGPWEYTDLDKWMDGFHEEKGVNFDALMKALEKVV